MKVIKLREGKERSLIKRHPWVFEGSIASGRADSRADRSRSRNRKHGFQFGITFAPGGGSG